jgi:hypothetical protein
MPTTRILLHGPFTNDAIAQVCDLATRVGVKVAFIDTDEAALVLADALQLSVLMDAVPPVASTLAQRQAWVLAFQAMMHRQSDVIVAAINVANARRRAKHH